MGLCGAGLDRINNFAPGGENFDTRRLTTVNFRPGYVSGRVSENGKDIRGAAPILPMHFFVSYLTACVHVIHN